MKPRLRKHRGWWYCGIPGDSLSMTVAMTPSEAYRLWARGLNFQTDAAADSAAQPKRQIT